MMIAAGAGYTAWHVLKEQPEERRKTFIRDSLVLTGAIGGSILAAKRWKPLEEEGALLVEHAKNALKSDGFNKDFPEVVQRLKQKFESLSDEHFLTKKDLEKLYEEIAAIPEVGHKKVGEVFEKLFDDGEGFQDEMKEALKFFGIGGIGVLGGIGGGMVANQINNVHEKWTVPNMIKEGIFQFVANIALCAVGAGAALGVLNSDELLGGKSALYPAAKAFTDSINNSPLKKLLRTGIILMGLSLGIVGGSHIANYVGSKWVNPLLDKLQGNPPSLKGLDDTRRLEVCDVVLHADDIPTAAAIAGTAILGPWIIPFFPVSGYRAGIGYRNDPASKAQKHPEKHQAQKIMESHRPATYVYVAQPTRTEGFGKSQLQPTRYPASPFAIPVNGGFYAQPQYQQVWAGQAVVNGKPSAWPQANNQAQFRY
jgi:hypothetical protein